MGRCWTNQAGRQLRASLGSALCLGLSGSIGLLSVACQQELTPRTTVDSLRILAIRAEPPEVAPGEGSIITALVVDPLGEARALDWTLSLCTPDDTTGSCLEYDSILEQYPDPEEAATEYAKCCARFGTETPEDGTLTLGGGFRSLITTTSDFLAETTELEALQGRNAQLNLLVCVSGVCQPPESEDGSQTDPEVSGISLPAEESALAIKRLRVTSVPEGERNHNPELVGLKVGVGGESPLEVDPEAPPVLQGGVSITVQPLLAAGDAECFTVYRSDGTTEQQLESPYFSWYVTVGEFSEYFSEPEFTEDCAEGGSLEERLEDAAVVLTLTDEEAALAESLTLYTVAYDRRGGMSWWIQQFPLQ